MGILFNDVVINKRSGGLGRRTPDQDMVSGLLFDVPSTTGKKKSIFDGDNVKLVRGEARRLASLEDAEGLGLTEDIDQGGCSVYYQISQFFRMNPSGDLWIMGVDATDYKGLVEKADQLLDAADGEIRQLGVTYSSAATVFGEIPDSGADPAPTEMPNSTIAAIGAAAKITEDAFLVDNRPVEILLEGKGFGSLTADVGGAPDLQLEAPNVSVVVAMDLQVANRDGNGFKNTAAVGVLLGAVSKAKVSENIAWVEKFNLTGDGFRSVGFVGGTGLTTAGDQKTLDDKRYIFTRKHNGISGLYFNDSHTCIERKDDFAFIEANRTINKAARIARTALLPKVNAPVLVDPDTGKLPPSVVKGYESLCRAALERMISNEEASEIDVFVDPNQDILADSILRVRIEVVPLGTARRIEVELGFKNPFQLAAAAAS